jgi:hypothetical protein
MAFDEGNAQAELGGDRGDGQAGGAGADDGEVVAGGGLAAKAPRVRAFQMAGSSARAARPSRGSRTGGVKMMARSGCPPAARMVPTPAPSEA